MVESVQEGYKKTEVGFIPEDWECMKLGDVADYVKGFAFKSKDYKKNGIRIIRVSDTTLDSIRDDNAVYLKEMPKKEYLKWKINEYDIIISTVGSKPPMFDSLVGKAILMDNKYAGSLLNQNAVILRAKKFNQYIQKLIYAQLKQPRYIKHIENIFRGNANQASITLVDLFKYELLIPKSKAEQTAIGEVLSDIDSLISSIKNLISKKQNIKQGAMQELLTGKRRLSGSSSEWEEKELGELAYINMGQSPDSKYYNANRIGIPLVQGNADMSNRKTIIRFYTSDITRVAEIGNLVMTVRAPVGYIAKTIFRCCLGRGVCSISYQNDYLYHYLIFIENTWTNLSTGSTFDSINSKNLKETKIKIPPTIEEQIAISKILSDMDEEIEKLTAKLNKYKSIKQGMMQELLTGKRRLV